MSLVDNLILNKTLRSAEIIRAFQKVKRSDFLPAEKRKLAEIDSPIALGYGQTNSQPSTVAFMLEMLEPEKGDKILDIGCGSGWTTALMAEIVGDEGKVYGIELIKALQFFAIANIKKYDYLDRGIVEILYKDGWQGLPDKAPFNNILVSAAA